METPSSLRSHAMLIPYMMRYKFQIVLTIVVSALAGMGDAACAWAIKPYIDSLWTGVDNGVASFAPFLLVGIIVIQSFARYLSDYLNAYVGQAISIDLKRDMYQSLLRNSTARFDHMTTGEVISGYCNDVDIASAGLVNNLRFIVSRIISSMALVFVLLYNSPVMAIFSVFMAVVTVFPMIRVRKRLRRINREKNICRTDVLDNYAETINGNKVIFAYELRGFMRRRLEKILARTRDTEIDMVKCTGGMRIFTHLAVAAGITGVMMMQNWKGSMFQLTPGNFISFITALLMLYNPLKNLGRNFHAVTVAADALERLEEKKRIQFPILDNSAANNVKTFSHSIVYENVWFSYGEGKPVLRGITFEVGHGQKVAIVGASGSGKSTLVSLLPKLYDASSGRILIDGVDVRDISAASLHDLVSVVFQDSFLFSGTILENILLGKNDATCDEVMAAVRNACLLEFIGSLPQGLDTQIGERGVRLSGGQRQRIAIARACIRQSPIIILDEATSALDNTSETLVHTAIDNLMEGRTILIVAHRLTTIVKADKIAVMDDGVIAEMGTHEELLAIPNGVYEKLYKRHFNLD